MFDWDHDQRGDLRARVGSGDGASKDGEGEDGETHCEGCVVTLGCVSGIDGSRATVIRMRIKMVVRLDDVIQSYNMPSQCTHQAGSQAQARSVISCS